MLNEGNQIHNFMSSSGSGSVINYGSGSYFLTSYSSGSGSGSKSQKVTVPTVPVPQHCNEGPVRIQYKCLVPIYVFLEMKLLFPEQNYNVLSPKSYRPISVRDFIYFQERSAYSAAGKYVDWSWKYINRSQTHKCGNWDWGRVIPRKGIFLAVWRKDAGGWECNCVSVIVTLQ